MKALFRLNSETLRERVRRHWRLDQETRKLCADMREYMIFLHAHRHVFLYGMNTVVESMILAMRLFGISPAGILCENIDSNMSQSTELPIFNLSEDIVDKKQDGIILCSLPEQTRSYKQKLDFVCGGINVLVANVNVEDVNPWHPSPYFVEYTELDSLGMKTGTDKAHCGHGYLDKYEFFLHPFRDKEICLLELGVAKGASLEMWSRFFSKARCIGVDISTDCLEYAGGNKDVIIADLDSEESLHQLAELHPDIIIDDASHLWSHQIMAIIMLWPVLPHGGIYIIEDIMTAYYPRYDDAVMSGYEFASDIARVVANKKFNRDAIMGLSGKKVFDKEVEAIASSVEMITFIEDACIIIKR